jgi:hypothetical protein
LPKMTSLTWGQRKWCFMNFTSTTSRKFFCSLHRLIFIYFSEEWKCWFFFYLIFCLRTSALFAIKMESEKLIGEQI